MQIRRLECNVIGKSRDLVLFFLDKYLLKAHFIVSIEKVQYIAAVSLVLQA